MRKVLFPLLALLAAPIVGCTTNSPNSPGERVAMQDEAKAAIERIQAQDPGVRDLLGRAYGYVIFPEVGEAAVGVGGAHGRGYAHQNGQLVGTVKLDEGSLGAQIGGATYAELIIFENEGSFNRLRNNAFTFGADANAVIVKAGASAATQFNHGVEVYVLPKGGLEVGIAIKGQKFFFTQADQNQ